MSPTLRRITKEAKSIQIYDRVIGATEKSLTKDFRRKFDGRLIAGSKGYGYWCWKPQIVLQCMQELDEGDLIQYTDAGCHLNPKGKPRLLCYFDLATEAKAGILAFQAKPPETHLGIDARGFLDFPEYKWAKGDLLDFFRVRHREDIWATPTVGAGAFFIRKCKHAVELIHEWRATFNHDFSLIDDSPSRSENLPGFIEHRHDQAIFSILCKLANVETLSAYELWHPNWEKLAEFPIHVRRDKKINLKSRLVRKLRTFL